MLLGQRSDRGDFDTGGSEPFRSLELVLVGKNAFTSTEVSNVRIGAGISADCRLHSQQ